MASLSLFPSSPRRVPSAVFSECEKHDLCNHQDCDGRLYRYLLAWPTGLFDDRVCMFVLANPSTASAEKTDRTVAKCIKYANRWGFGWCHVVNCRAWRATNPKDVPADPEAIGTWNDRYIEKQAEQAELVVCGWGKLGGTRGPVVLDIIRAAGKVPLALKLKLNQDGSPAHPLYLRGDLVPQPMGALRD